MRSWIEFHPENGAAPWVVRVSGMWFAYPSLLRAVFKFPRLAWSFRNITRGSDLGAGK